MRCCKALRSEADLLPDSPGDMTVAPRTEERTRGQLEAFSFTDPNKVLKALEQLPNVMKAASNELGIYRQMLKVIMDAMREAIWLLSEQAADQAGPECDQGVACSLRLTVVGTAGVACGRPHPCRRRRDGVATPSA